MEATGSYITSSGNFYSSNGNFRGHITARSGTIEGNLQILSDGSFFTGNGTSSSVVINTNGLAALNSAGAGTTEILTSAITFGSTPRGNDTGATSGSPLPVAINLFSKGAMLGGWVVGPTTITDRSQQFILDSSTSILSIFGSISNVNYGLKLGTGANVIEAGTRDGSNNITNPSFYVTKGGLLTANNATIRGSVTANNGGFGTVVNNAVTVGWEIGASGLTAVGQGRIAMGSVGRITMGNYQIFADASTGFRIFDGTGNVLSISDVSGTTDPGRLLLGQAAASGVVARQVEVAKEAQISGSYAGGTTEDYRSGGLRNMYTITVNQFATYPNAFPSAASGAVLLVYDPTSA